MHLNDRVIRLPRRAAAMAAAVPAALLVAGLATGVASAAPGDDITETCLETSQNGSPWELSDDNFSPEGTGYIPIPGAEGVQLEFDVRNKCDVPATLTIYSKDWTVGKDATATVRGAIDGVKGEKFIIGPGEDASARIVLQQKVLPKNVATPIEYLIGIPWEEGTQNYGINPGWGFVLIEDEPAIVAPGAPTDVVFTPEEAEVGAPITVSGNAEPGSTVTVTGGGAACTATADATTGAFSCPLTINKPGDHTITVVAGNSAGNGPAATAGPVTVTDPNAPGDGDCEANGSVAGSLGSTGSLGSVSDFLCASGGSLGSLVDRN